jgi:hypothetical protein
MLENIQDYKLEENEEFMFEVDFGSKVQIQALRCNRQTSLTLASYYPEQLSYSEQSR